MLLLWNNASVIYLHSWYFLTAAAHSFPPVSWTKAVSKDRDSSKTTLCRTYRGERILDHWGVWNTVKLHHPNWTTANFGFRNFCCTHVCTVPATIKHIYCCPFCITNSHRQNTHTFQKRQTRACSSCDPLESSYKMLSPPASPGMDCFLQHTHTHKLHRHSVTLCLWQRSRIHIKDACF